MLESSDARVAWAEVLRGAGAVPRSAALKDVNMPAKEVMKDMKDTNDINDMKDMNDNELWDRMWINIYIYYDI